MPTHDQHRIMRISNPHENMYKVRECTVMFIDVLSVDVTKLNTFKRPHQKEYPIFD
jgi:hypothetical protein